MNSFSFAFSSSFRFPRERSLQSLSGDKDEQQRTLKFDANPMWDSLDALCPQRLVQLRIDPDVGGAHCLLGKVDDGLDGPRGTLFEGAAVDAFV